MIWYRNVASPYISRILLVYTCHNITESNSIKNVEIQLFRLRKITLSELELDDNAYAEINNDNLEPSILFTYNELC